MILKGADQLSEVPDMGRGMGEVHNVMTGIRFAYEVAGGTSVGNKRRRSGGSKGGTVEGREGALTCGMKDMGPYTGINPGRVIG